jgi:hypothetical protein
VRGVAPDELPDAGAGRLQVASFELAFDGEGGSRKTAHREGGGDKPDLERPTELWRREAQCNTDKPTGERRKRHCQEHPRQRYSAGAFEGKRPVLEDRDGAAHEDDGMRGLRRFTKDGVG